MDTCNFNLSINMANCLLFEQVIRIKLVAHNDNHCNRIGASLAFLAIYLVGG